MHAIILAAALLCNHADVEDGTLLFLTHGSRVVQYYTDSEITHVAVVMNRDGEPFVYEASPGEVRRVALADYYEEIAALNEKRSKPIQVWMLRPATPYSPQQLTSMHAYLDSQLQRRYSVRGYVRNKPSDGIHCAELAANVLNRTARTDFEKCYDMSPGKLVAAIESLHQPAGEVALSRQQPKPSWRERTWQDWTSFKSWCSWSCYETWMFCR
jgi:hypothetical protein